MFANDRQPVAYYIRPASIKQFGPKAVFTNRVPLVPQRGISPDKLETEGTYQDDTFVVDCVDGTFVQAEKTIFNNAGVKILHYSWGEPQSLNPSQKIAPGSILGLAKNLACNKSAMTPLITKGFSNVGFSYAGNTPDGAGQIFSNAPKQVLDAPYQSLATIVGEYPERQDFTQLADGHLILGLPIGFRYNAQRVRFYCWERKVDIPISQYLDDRQNLVYAEAPTSALVLQPASGSIFEI